METATRKRRISRLGYWMAMAMALSSGSLPETHAQVASCVPVNSASDRDPSAPPPTTKPFKRGDVNGDGIITQQDINAISKYVTGDRSVLTTFDVADVNNDNKIDANDKAYLVNYSSRRGPQPPEPFTRPAHVSVAYCTESPCFALFNHQVIKYTAQRVFQNAASADWRAVAYDRNNRPIAQYRVSASYGATGDTYQVSYHRNDSAAHGWTAIPPLAGVGTKPATYHTAGTQLVRDQIDTSVALWALQDLMLAEAPQRQSRMQQANPGQPRGGNPEFPRCPNGCSGPINVPPIKTTPEQDACCNAHDDCYARGGNRDNKNACDKALTDCLGPVTPTYCKILGYSPLTLFFNPISQCLRNTFADGAFRWTDEQCTCNIDTAKDPNACAFGDDDKKTATQGNGTLVQSCDNSKPCNGSCTVLWPQPDGNTKTSSYACSNISGSCSTKGAVGQ